uniref:CASP-like protein n=1 Tax=Anthurium amnicola TaxID=1678845 RepID=A0A1D1XVF0_9ARAE
MAKPRNVFLVMLRILALAATLSSALVMATSHQTTTIFNLTLEAKFQYMPAFKVLVYVNSAVTVYSLLVLFIPPTSSLSRIVVPLDALIAMLLTGTLAAAASVSYTGKKGNPHAGWLPICDQVSDFCNQVMGSLVCAFVGVLVYTSLLLYTIQTVINPLLV